MLLVLFHKQNNAKPNSHIFMEIQRDSETWSQLLFLLRKSQNVLGTLFQVLALPKPKCRTKESPT